MDWFERVSSGGAKCGSFAPPELEESKGNPTRQTFRPSRDFSNRLYGLVERTGMLERFVVFGSYVTDKPAPNDVDILIMRDDFREEDYTDEVLMILDHLRVQSELGASVFWTRSGAVLLESVDEFIAHWQIKRNTRVHHACSASSFVFIGLHSWPILFLESLSSVELLASLQSGRLTRLLNARPDVNQIGGL